MYRLAIDVPWAWVLSVHVLLGCRDAGRGERAAAETGGTFLQTLDVGDAASCGAYVDAVKVKYGRLDCLVNNAGTAFKGADACDALVPCQSRMRS